jgi:hypothetical protein
MLKFYVYKRIITGFFIALAILSCLALTSCLNNRKLISNECMVAIALVGVSKAEQAYVIAGNFELSALEESLTNSPGFARSKVNMRAIFLFHDS